MPHSSPERGGGGAGRRGNCRLQCGGGWGYLKDTRMLGLSWCSCAYLDAKSPFNTIGRLPTPPPQNDSFNDLSWLRGFS